MEHLTSQWTLMTLWVHINLQKLNHTEWHTLNSALHLCMWYKDAKPHCEICTQFQHWNTQQRLCITTTFTLCIYTWVTIYCETLCVETLRPIHAVTSSWLPIVFHVLPFWITSMLSLWGNVLLPYEFLLVINTANFLVTCNSGTKRPQQKMQEQFLDIENT